MKEHIIAFLKIAAPLCVALSVFAAGLEISPSRVLGYFKERPGLILRSLFAVLVLVPAAALAIILVLQPAVGTGVGLAILVACPPAPLMFKSAPQKGASQALMAFLHLGLAALSFVTVPAVLFVISQPLGFHADVDLTAMALILGKTILVPISLGLIVHGAAPAFAEKVAPLLAKIGSIGILIVLLVMLAALFPQLAKMDPWSYFVVAVVSASALAIGHFAGPEDPQEKTAVAVECGVRHPALALAIGSANFRPERALPVLVPCVITFIVMASIYLAWRGKSAARGKPGATPATSAQAGA
jgi:BASS family bile acid:Na+ symporter